jgi:L-histidine Nalpha-methyltransferase
LNEFSKDILTGLRGAPKRLSSKYFYDEEGDALFRKIMELPEYYLTRAEASLLETHKETLRLALGPQALDIIEPGAGSGEKTKILLRHFLERQSDCRYLPIDISQNALDLLSASLRRELPGLEVQGLAGDYFNKLHDLPFEPGRRKLVLFLGSNIGNFPGPEAEALLRHISDGLAPGDFLLIGFDLKKDPAVILAAYDDAAGVTRDFNLNLLTRINRELGGNFRLEAFRHWATYNPLTGACKSYLVSLKTQTVRLEALGADIHFRAWEAIHMELSQKYDLDMAAALAAGAGFEGVGEYVHGEHGYLVALWRKP